MINGICGPNYQEKDLAPQEENQPRKVTINPVGEWNETGGSKNSGISILRRERTRRGTTLRKQMGAMVGGRSDPWD